MRHVLGGSGVALMGHLCPAVLQLEANTVLEEMRAAT
jgi:hypothetical protein